LLIVSAGIRDLSRVITVNCLENPEIFQFVRFSIHESFLSQCEFQYFMIFTFQIAQAGFATESTFYAFLPASLARSARSAETSKLFSPLHERDISGTLRILQRLAQSARTRVAAGRAQPEQPSALRCT
jgi:hypothetical protein